jgi:outer membrane immunogenic protein
LGFGWADISGIYVLPPPDHHSTSSSKAWYDSHIGFQWQFNNIVLGVEGTYATPLSSSFGSTASPGPDCFGATPIANRLCESRLRNVWAFGGKAGWAWDRVLVYGTGGFASTRLESRDRIANTGVVNISEANKYTHDGWYAGGGVDWFITKFFFSDVILGVEYRHYEFDTVRHFPSAPGTPAPLLPNADTRDMSATLDTVSARLTFKWTP